MITENLSTLKIHKLTQEQYDRELQAGNIDETAMYLTPDNMDADTLDGLHASDFASASYVSSLGSSIITLQSRVGDESVETQINNALANFSSDKTLTEHLIEEDMVLSSRQYGDTLPDHGTPGRIFFLKVSD